MTPKRRKRRWRAPDELGPNPLRMTDKQATAKIRDQARTSRQLMAEFDRLPPVVRHVEHAVGNVNIARRLVSRGVTTTEQAEPIVRRMLEDRWKSG